MARFDEMSLAARAGILIVVTVVLGVLVGYFVINPIYQSNEELRVKIRDKKDENQRLRGFEAKLADINRQMAILQQQMEIQKKIVPEDRDSEQFIKLLHDTAATAGIEIRRYASLDVANHEFYSDVPFTLDIDGPYYSVMDFFQKISEKERIVNIGNLQMTNIKTTGGAKVKKTYAYAPGETVVASCTATTFFSHDQIPEPQTQPGTKK